MSFFHHTFAVQNKTDKTMVKTKQDMDKALMMKIIGGFNDDVCRLTQEMVAHRHHSRMVMLVRWKFLRHCEKNRLSSLSLEGFGHDLVRAEIRMWLDSPYMRMVDKEGKEWILYQYPDETLKDLYNYIKGLNHD